MVLARDGSQILVIGPAVWRFDERWDEDQPILVVDLVDGPVADNTVLLRWNDLVGARACLISRNHVGAVVLDSPLFCQLVPSRTVEDIARRHWAGLSAAPLFLFGRSGPEIVVHALVRLGEHDGLFIRADTLTHPDNSVDLAILMYAALTSTSRNREFLNNHQCCYQKFWPGEELEHKITMPGPVDLHAVTVGLRNLVGSPYLPGTIWDYRDDYQIWDFNNHMFEVLDPPTEAGYISFIPDSSGTMIVKRKWFTCDSPRRRETRWRGVPIPNSADGFESYVRSHLSGQFRFVGSFRRTRFDSTCEFTRTGNIYGFMVDWCRPLARPETPHLYQIEIEYLHSRTLNTAARCAVGSELAVLGEATRAYLDQVGIAHRPGESKLTYMRSLRLAEGP